MNEINRQTLTCTLRFTLSWRSFVWREKVSIRRRATSSSNLQDRCCHRSVGIPRLQTLNTVLILQLQQTVSPRWYVWLLFPDRYNYAVRFMNFPTFHVNEVVMTLSYMCMLYTLCVCVRWDITMNFNQQAVRFYAVWGTLILCLFKRALRQKDHWFIQTGLVF